jgi:hypothetical protein
MIAAPIVNQMKVRANRYFHTPVTGVKNPPIVASATIVKLPPTHIGFDTQYSTELMHETRRPNDNLVQTYGPPS